MTITYADLFAGIGGFSMGLKSLLQKQSRLAFACEFDTAAAQTYWHNFHHYSFGDMRTNPFSGISCDIAFGGFPCQAFSRNGVHYNSGRSSMDGKPSLVIQDESETRDKLYLELVRFLKAVRPARFLFENVRGLLSMRTADDRPYFDLIRSAFEDCGYSVFTKVLDTADYGLPQQRRRLFFAGFRNDIAPAKFSFPEPLPRTSCVRDILQHWVDDKYLLENLWKNRMCHRLRKEPESDLLSRLGALKIAYAEQLVEKPLPPKPTGKIEPIAIIYNDTPSGGPRQMDKLYSIMGISPTIATFSTPAFDTPQGWRILTPRECARLQGFPDSFILPKSDTVAYKQVGNAVSVRVVAAILEKML